MWGSAGRLSRGRRRPRAQAGSSSGWPCSHSSRHQSTPSPVEGTQAGPQAVGWEAGGLFYLKASGKASWRRWHMNWPGRMNKGSPTMEWAIHVECAVAGGCLVESPGGSRLLSYPGGLSGRNPRRMGASAGQGTPAQMGGRPEHLLTPCSVPPGAPILHLTQNQEDRHRCFCEEDPGRGLVGDPTAQRPLRGRCLPTP